MASYGDYKNMSNINMTDSTVFVTSGYLENATQNYNDTLDKINSDPDHILDQSDDQISEKSLADADWDKDLRIIILWVEIILGSIGGILVCIWLFMNRGRKSRVNVIIGHVMASDLLVMVVTLAQVIWEMVDRWWLAGDAMCRVVKFMQSFALMASSFMLVVLSFDRHQAIRSPLREPIKVWRLSLAGWIPAALLSIPMFTLFHVVDNPTNDTTSFFYNKTVCEGVFRHRPISHRHAFLTFVSIVHVFLPCVLIAVCYIRIVHKIWTKARESSSTKKNVKPGKIQLQSTQSTSLTKAKIKTLKMTVVIVTAFIVCGLPYHILEMCFNFSSYTVPPHVVAILGALPVAHSVINPYIFLFFNTNYHCLKRTIRPKTRRDILYTKSGGHSYSHTENSTVYYDVNSSIEMTPVRGNGKIVSRKPPLYSHVS